MLMLGGAAPRQHDGMPGSCAAFEFGQAGVIGLQDRLLGDVLWTVSLLLAEITWGWR